MEIYTMNREYGKLSEVDYYSSAIWTERVLGDADFQLDVPALPYIIRALSVGTRVGLLGSKEVMMVEKQSIKDNVLTATGTSLTQQLNNRFVRFTDNPADKSAPVVGTPGYILQYMVYNMCIGGPFLSGATPIGFTPVDILRIPDFTIDTYDNTLSNTVIAIPYGQLYDAMKTIAQAYNVCQRVELHGVSDIRYRNWLGVDHTTDSHNALVRFSPDLDNFGDTTEVVDGTKFKTHVWVYPSSLPIDDTFHGGPGVGSLQGDEFTGFDLRAAMVMADDITTEGTGSNFTSAIIERVQEVLGANRIISAVDGTISPDAEYVYGRHYDLGDTVEVQGSSGLLHSARVTEYIRSKDASGEKAYPTLTVV